MSNDTILMHFIRSKELVNWSVPYLIGIDFNFNPDFNLVKISEFLKRNKTAIEVQDDDEYKRVTIKVRNGGIHLRDIAQGNKIGTKKQFLIKEGQFLLSKIDARNGAFGVVPPIVDCAIITGNFWTFDVDYNLVNPHFLSLLTTTKKFIRFAEITSNGSTNRHYLQEDLFLNTPIPLPSLDEQNRMVNSYRNKIDLAKEQEAKANKLEEDVEIYLLESLGIKPLEKVERKFQELQFIRSKEVNRWGVEFNLYARLEEDIFKSDNYKNISIQEYFQINPTIGFRDLSQFDEISFVPMEAVSDKEGTITKRRISEPQQGYTRFHEGDIIWARITPCMENKKCAIATDLINGFGIGSTEFHVLKRINKGFDVRLLHFLLRTNLLTANAKFYFTGSAGQQRVPKEFLENLFIPVPPVNVQQEIIEHIIKIKLEISELRINIKQNKESALDEFEKEIFQAPK